MNNFDRQGINVMLLLSSTIACNSVILTETGTQSQPKHFTQNMTLFDGAI